MFLINDEEIESQSFLNIPIIFDNDLCMIYPLTVKEIIIMKESVYRFYLNSLVLSTSEIEEILKKKGVELSLFEGITAFEYLMQSAKNSNTFLLELEKAFSTFIREPVLFLFDENKIVIGEDFSEQRFLTSENFLEFQNILRIQNKVPTKVLPPENEDPRMKKFRLKREERDRVKAKLNSEKDTIPLIDLMTSLCAYGVGITPFNVGNLSICAFYAQLARIQEKEKYDLDVSQLLAGADSKKINLVYWIRKLTKKE